MILGRAKDRRIKAQEALAAGETAKAVRLYQRLVDASPRDLQIRRALGDAYRADGQIRLAIDTYEAVAGAHAASGLLLRAIATCKLILDLDPEHRATQRMLAALYAKKKRSGAPRAALLSSRMSAALTDGSMEDMTAEIELSSGEFDVMPGSNSSKALPPEFETVPHTDEGDGSDTDENRSMASFPPALPDDISMEGAPIMSAPPPGVPISTEASALDVEVVSGDLIILEDDTENTPRAEVNLEALPKSPFFSALPREAFEELVSRIDVLVVEENEPLVNEGAPGDELFVLVSGEASVSRLVDDEPEVLARLCEGDFFGEMAILSGNPRTATVTTTAPSELLVFQRSVLQEVFSRWPVVELAVRTFCRERLLANLMRNSSLFSGLREGDKQRIIDEFRDTEVSADTTIIAEDGPGQGLYVVLAGGVEVRKSSEEGFDVITELRDGDVFGEMSLLTGEAASASVVALRRTFLLHLSQETFVEFCSRHPDIARRLTEIAEEREQQNLERLEEAFTHLPMV